MDIVGALDLLYQDSKSRYGFRDGNVLALSYGASLVRRMERRAEARDEVAIALCMRPRVQFGFIAVEEENVCEVQSATAINRQARLNGSIAGRVALSGEANQFGVSALATLALPKGQLEKAD